VIQSSFHQIVTFPTRDLNTLDVILTTDTSLFSNVAPDLPVGTSHHSSVRFEISLPVNPRSGSCLSLVRSPSIRKYNWYEGDYNSLGSFLSSIDRYSFTNKYHHHFTSDPLHQISKMLQWPLRETLRVVAISPSVKSVVFSSLSIAILLKIWLFM